MNDSPASFAGSARSLAHRIAQLGLAGVALMLTGAALAVTAPLIDLAAVRAGAQDWLADPAWPVVAAGASGVLLLAVLTVLVALVFTRRQLARLRQQALGWVDERHSAVQARQRAQAQLQALALAVPQGLALTRQRRFEWANARFCEQLGWAPSELLGRSAFELFSSVNADDSLGAALRDAFAAGQPYAGELHFRRRDGSRFWGRLQARQVDPAEPAAGTLWQLDAVSPPQTLRAPAPQAAPGAASGPAAHDPLTGLLSRPAFEHAVTAWLAQAPADRPAALLHLDLDGFKRYNDAAGRDAGDALLRAAAVVLQAHVRAGDAVARLEGDTYALLLPGCVAAVAVQLGDRLRAELAGLGGNHQGRRLGVGATVGVAEIDRRAAGGASAWLARSQAAWYEAKYGGRGAVRVAAPASALAVVLPA